VVTIGVRSKPYGIVARPEAVWVVCYGDQSLVRIDPRTQRTVGAPITVGLNPVGLDVTDDHVAWVTGAADDSLTRLHY
jgi:streptogramin lyase